MVYIKSILQTLKSDGIKVTFKKHGWKAVALVFGYYLVRDVTLYVILPLVVASIGAQ